MAMMNFSDALLTNARARASSATGYSQPNRMGKTTYDCSSFVGRNLRDLGFNINPGITTRDITPNSQMMRNLGFQWVPKGQGYQAGDILWKNGHTEIYSGGRNTIGAHSTKNGVSEYDKQNLNSFAGGWRYVGDRFLGGAGTQGADRINAQGTPVAQGQGVPQGTPQGTPQGMADPALQQAVMQSQGVQPTVVLQMPREEPRGFSGWSSMPMQDYSGLVNQGNAQAMQMAMNAGQGLQFGRRGLV